MSLASPKVSVRAVALALLLACVLAAPARPVWACSCAFPQTPDVAFDQAYAVFSGTVSKIVDRGPYGLWDRFVQWLGSQPPNWHEPRLVTLVVSASWKTVTETPVAVGTGYGGGDCGYSFNVGGQYVVYAYQNSGALATNMCLRTAELAQASADLAYLQTQPALPVTPARPSLPLICWVGAVGVLGVLALAGGAFWALRRRKRPKSAALPPPA